MNVKSLDKPEVKKFVEFYLKHVENLAKEVKYIPLPAESYVRVKARLEKKKKEQPLRDMGTWLCRLVRFWIGP